MAKIITVTDADGKQVDVNCDHIVSMEHEPGDPAEPAVEAADEVADDPGEEPSALHPLGRPPKKGHPKVEAKPAKDGTPDKSTIKMVDGSSVKVSGTIKALRDAVG